MSTKKSTCPSFSASLSEYLLGEPRFVSIPVSSQLSQCFCHIFFCLQYPFERDPPSRCSKLLEEGSPHPPDKGDKIDITRRSFKMERITTNVTWNWVTCASVTGACPTIVCTHCCEIPPTIKRLTLFKCERGQWATVQTQGHTKFRSAK